MPRICTDTFISIQAERSDSGVMGDPGRFTCSELMDKRIVYLDGEIKNKISTDAH